MCLCNRASGLVARCTQKPKYHFGQFCFLLKEKGFIAGQPSREWNQSILKEINLEYSLEGLMLNLKLQYFGHLMGRADSPGKPLMLGNIESKRRGRQRMRWLDSIINSMGMSFSKLWEMVKDMEARHSVVHGVPKCWTLLVTEQQQAGRREAKFRSVSPVACDWDVYSESGDL